MLNTDNFGKRLTIILDHYGLSASAFADLIQVQRSSISHILSGRNKPSLDFILKLNTACPDINMYWFLNGSGSLTNNATPPSKQSSLNKKSKPSVSVSNHDVKQLKKIDKIVVFYEDGTFQAYNSEKSERT